MIVMVVMSMSILTATGAVNVTSQAVVLILLVGVIVAAGAGFIMIVMVVMSMTILTAAGAVNVTS